MQGNGADEATHGQAGHWPQQESHSSDSEFQHAKFKAQKTRKEVNWEIRLLQRIKPRFPQVGGLSYAYSMYLLFTVCLPPKKD